MEGTTIKVGIIGLGFGKTVAQAFKAVDPSCEVYLAARDLAKVQKVSQEIRASGVYENWSDLISDSKIDLVVIATPNNFHREMFEKALSAGKHVLLEKPAATSAQAIREMEALAKDSDRMVVVDHEARFNPLVLYLREMIRRETFGKILTLRIGAYLNWFSQPNFRGHHIQTRTAGGGQLFMIGVHLIDLGRFLLGDPIIKSGFVQTQVYQDPRLDFTVDAETQFAATFSTVGGTSLQLYNDSYGFGYKDFVLEVLGSQGIALYRDSQGLKISLASEPQLKSVVIDDPLPQITLGNSLLSRSIKYLAAAFLQSLRSGQFDDRFCTLSQARENLEYLERFQPKGI